MSKSSKTGKSTKGCGKSTACTGNTNKPNDCCGSKKSTD